MPKARISAAEAVVCQRLRQARERLGLTQVEAAERIGMTRDRLNALELSRSHLRCDLALRICRQLVLSEEWLATGRYDAARAAIEQGTSPLDPAEVHRLDYHFLRQCMDLGAEDEFHGLPFDSLFTAAYSTVLAPVYSRLVLQSPWRPRIVFRDVDRTQLMQDYFSVVMNHSLVMLEWKSETEKKAAGAPKRSYLEILLLFENVLLFRYLGSHRPDADAYRLELLQAVISGAQMPHAPAADEGFPPPRTPLNKVSSPHSSQRKR